MSPSLEAAAAAPALAVPLAIWMPALPLRTSQATWACRTLMLGGFVLLAAAVALPLAGVWSPAPFAMSAALTCWLVMFWIARRPDVEAPPRTEKRRPDRDDEDDSGGGGGNDPRPPRAPEPTGGLELDWAAFDRAREEWSITREPELEPAV